MLSPGVLRGMCKITIGLPDLSKFNPRNGEDVPILFENLKAINYKLTCCGEIIKKCKYIE